MCLETDQKSVKIHEKFDNICGEAIKTAPRITDPNVSREKESRNHLYQRHLRG